MPSFQQWAVHHLDSGHADSQDNAHLGLKDLHLWKSTPQCTVFIVYSILLRVHNMKTIFLLCFCFFPYLLKCFGMKQTRWLVLRNRYSTIFFHWDISPSLLFFKRKVFGLESLWGHSQICLDRWIWKIQTTQIISSLWLLGVCIALLFPRTSLSLWTSHDCFCFGTTCGCALSLLLTLYLGIIPGSTCETIWGTGD